MTKSNSQVQVSILARLGSGFTSAFQAADRQMSQLGQHAQDLQRKIGDISAYRRQENALKESAAAYSQARKRAQELKAAIDKAGGDGNAVRQRMAQTAQAAKEAAAAMELAKAKALTMADAIAKTQKPTAEQRAALKAAKEEAKQAAAAYKATRDALAQLEKEERAANAALQKNKSELQQAQAEAKRLGATYQQARTRLAEMGRELQRNGVNASRLSGEYRRLQNELAQTNGKQAQAERSLQRQQQIVNGMRTAVSAMAGSWEKIKNVAAGTVAAGAFLQQPLKKALSYEEQLTYMADTAGAGKSAAEKLALQKQLSDSVENARQFSKGATREDVATALSTIIASGKFQGAEAMQVLPSVARTAFAGGANPEDIAKTAIAMKQFGIKDVGAEFDKILRAGQLGNFEMKDMAKYLPQQLALARAAGYTGKQGITDLLAFNQVAMTTAGTQDEAGNNVVNLLQKFSSREFSKAMADNVKVQKGDPTTTPDAKGKKKPPPPEFDWAQYAMRQREKGVGAVEAFGMILERQLAGNKQYQELQKRIAGAKTNEEKKATLEAMGSIAEGSELGKIIADRQALMAALAALYGKQQMKDIKEGIDKADGAVQQSAEFVGSQNFAKTKLLEGNVNRANESTYGEVGGALGGMLDKINGLTQEFPRLATAAYGAATALGAIAAAGIGAGIMGALGKGGGAAAGGGLLSRLFGSGAVPAATTVAAGGTAAAQGAAVAGAAAGAAASGGMLAKVANVAKGGAIMAGMGYATDAAAGALGAGGNKIDEKQDDENWSRMSTGQKVMSGAARGIEGIGSLLFLDNIVNSARASRIKSETEMLNGSPVAPAKQEPALKAGDTGKENVSTAQKINAAGQPQPQGAAGETKAVGTAKPDGKTDGKQAGPIQTPAQGNGATALAAANSNATNTASAAQEAAKAAQEAAKAATIKPNVNISNSYSVKVDVAQPGAVELGAQLDKALRDMQRKADAETRAKWIGSPAY